MLAAARMCLDVSWDGLVSKVTCGCSTSSTISGIACHNGFLTAFLPEASAAYGTCLILWVDLKREYVAWRAAFSLWIVRYFSAICGSWGTPFFVFLIFPQVRPYPWIRDVISVKSLFLIADTGFQVGPWKSNSMTAYLLKNPANPFHFSGVKWWCSKPCMSSEDKSLL